MAIPALFDLNKGRTYAVSAALSRSGRHVAIYQGNDVVSLYKIGKTKTEAGSMLSFAKVAEIDESLAGLKRAQDGANGNGAPA